MELQAPRSARGAPARRACSTSHGRSASPTGGAVPGLHAVWITLDNPRQHNSYTTEMVKGVIAGMRRASNDRAAVAVVLTGAGDRAFCTGGNTAEYAEYYAGRPEEYRQYMRLFNDMVSVDPALRQAGDLPGQRHAHRRRAGDRHGLRLLGRPGPGAVRPGRPAPRLGPRRRQHRLPAAVRRHRGGDGELHAVPALERAQGATDSACSRRIVPALTVDGRVRREPARGHRALARRAGPHRPRRAPHGRRSGRGQDARRARDDRPRRCSIGRSSPSSTPSPTTMPGCLTKTLESVRKHKLEHWDRNRETQPRLARH